jgi:hypothetical protein
MEQKKKRKRLGSRKRLAVMFERVPNLRRVVATNKDRMGQNKLPAAFLHHATLYGRTDRQTKPSVRDVSYSLWRNGGSATQKGMERQNDR